MKILLAKTALDGHWRGVNVVARALRDDGHEVVMLGMARDDEIAAVAIDEDVDLVGLNVGGRVEVVERIVAALREAAPDLPVFAGGIVPPWAARRLEAQGIAVYPPGSSLADIVDAARRLATDAASDASTPAPSPSPAERRAVAARRLLASAGGPGSGTGGAGMGEPDAVGPDAHAVLVAAARAVAETVYDPRHVGPEPKGTVTDHLKALATVAAEAGVVRELSARLPDTVREPLADARRAYVSALAAQFGDRADAEVAAGLVVDALDGTWRRLLDGHEVDGLAATYVEALGSFWPTRPE